MSSTSSNTGEFTYNELMEQYVKATRLIEHLKSQRDRSKRAFDKAMDLVLKYDARIAELEGLVDELIEEGAWGAELAINIGALSGADQYKLAKKRYDKWDALVKDWEERER